MRTTTHHGWPVAQGTDPVKQYPAAVDGPFKDAIDVTVYDLEQVLAGIGLVDKMVKVGNVTATTNVNGVIMVPFGVSFDSAPVVVFSGGDLSNMVAAQSLALLNANLTPTQMMIGEYQKTAGAVVRLHYIAVGPLASAARAAGKGGQGSFEVMSDSDTPYPAPPDSVGI